jgi:hypothetical protein
MWIKKAGRIVDDIVRELKEEAQDIEILEMDELFTFIKKTRRNKKAGEWKNPHTRIWTAVDRNSFKTIAFKIGNRNKNNFIELALQIEGKCHSIEYLCTDKNP